MLARVFVPLVSLVGLVVSAPAKVEGRQAPSGVPDYVLKYGKKFGRESPRNEDGVSLTLYPP